MKDWLVFGQTTRPDGRAVEVCRFSRADTPAEAVRLLVEKSSRIRRHFMGDTLSVLTGEKRREFLVDDDWGTVTVEPF